MLDQISLNDLIETDFTIIYNTETLAEVIDKAYNSKRNIFPLVDNELKFVGIIHLADIKDYVFKKKPFGNYLITKFVKPSPGIIAINDSVVVVMQKFELNDAWHIPVLEEGKYIGFVSRSRLLNLYRKLIQQERQIF